VKAWCLGALALGVACNPVERAKRELAFVQGEERRVQAEVRAAGQATVSLERAVLVHQARLNRAQENLSAAQTEAASLWHGDERELATKLALAPSLSAPFRQALSQAQAAGSRQVAERRFEAALKHNDLAALGPLVSNLTPWTGLEDEPSDAGVSVQVVEVPCKISRTLPCKAIDLDALWCTDAKRHAAHAVIDHGEQVELVTWPGGDALEPAARLAPGVWLNHGGLGDQEVFVLSAVRGATWATLWYGSGRSTEASATDGGQLEAPLERALLNLDGDEFLEGLFWTQAQLTLVHPTDWNSAEVLKNLTACDALFGNRLVPAPVSAWCRAHQGALDGGH
jgi:hypothetical protein